MSREKEPRDADLARDHAGSAVLDADLELLHAGLEVLDADQKWVTPLHKSCYWRMSACSKKRST